MLVVVAIIITIIIMGGFLKTYDIRRGIGRGIYLSPASSKLKLNGVRARVAFVWYGALKVSVSVFVC